MREDFFKLAAGLIALLAALLIIDTLANFDQMKFTDVTFLVGGFALVIVFGRYSLFSRSPHDDD